MKKVIIVHRSVDADPRSAKLIQALWEKNYDICFVGWDSTPSVSKPSFHNVPIKKAILKCKAPSGIKALVFFPIFFLHVCRHIILFRPTVVHCVNEEVALLLLILKPLLFKRLVVDIYDSLGLRIRNRNILMKKILDWLCDFTYKFSDLIIVTNQIRYDLIKPRHQKKTIVIENTIDGEPPAGEEPAPNQTVKLCVSGVLAKSRGLEQLIEAIDDTTNVEVVALGILDDDFAKSVFINHPKVRYLGFFSQHDGLRIASECQAVFAYYEPVSINNIYASPNKVFDAMFLGRPLIINAETLISKWIEDEQLGFRVPYHDTDKLREVLENLSRRTMDEQHSFQQRVQKLFKKEFSWGKMKIRLQEAYDDLFSV